MNFKNFSIKLGEIGWRIGKDQARDSLIYASQQFCYDPVVQYLQDLEQQEKEGKLYQADINNVASDYLGIDDPLSNKMVKVWLVGSIARHLKGVINSTLCWYCTEANE